jgi:hypothetical protein
MLRVMHNHGFRRLERISQYEAGRQLLRFEPDRDFSGPRRMDGLKTNLGGRSRCVEFQTVELSETEHPAVNNTWKLVFG